MKILKCGLSATAPNNVDLWAKPVDGGFTLYIKNGTWKPLKLVEDQNTEDTSDDIIQDLIGSVKDKKSANTINGAKAYAKDAANTIKKYVDEKLAELEKSKVVPE